MCMIEKSLMVRVRKCQAGTAHVGDLTICITSNVLQARRMTFRDRFVADVCVIKGRKVSSILTL